MLTDSGLSKPPLLDQLKFPLESTLGINVVPLAPVSPFAPWIEPLFTQPLVLP